MKRKTSRFLLLLGAMSAISLVWLSQPARRVAAAPPAPLTFSIIQPDGITIFQARAWGDERSNGLETVAGYTVLQDSGTGYWFYAELDRVTGQLTATHKAAGKDTPPLSAYQARPITIQSQDQVVAQGPVGVLAVPTLVFLVQYTEQPAISTPEDWIDAVFGPANSVKDYYQEISYNQFNLSPAQEACGTLNDGVTDWITLGTTHPNSGGPSIALAALTAADNCIDYAVFDKNGDGQITGAELLPIIIVAGYENSYGGDLALAPNVWGHQGSVNFHSVSDRVTVLPYAQFGEWQATTWDYPGHRATIGLMVHEVGHLLGWPDLYDNLPPGNPDSEGVGNWSVMGTGLWLGETYLGDTPAHPSAWEKWYQGWLSPLQLQGVHPNQPIPRVEDNNSSSVIQLLDNPEGVNWSFGDFSGTGEYFLVENRQKIGYDAQLPGCGLLIWHVDESLVSSNWANSNEDHKLVDLEEADGLVHLDTMTNRGDGGDPYPGLANNVSFNNLSNPDSNLYDGHISGVSVTNISPGCADIKWATVAAPSTVRLTKTAAPNPVGVGRVFTYTLTVSNQGAITVGDISIADTVPEYTTLKSASLSGDATYTGRSPGSLIIWSPGVELTPGEILTRTFAVTADLRVADGTRIVNEAYLTSNVRSDSSSIATTVAAPDLRVSIVPDPFPIETNTTGITYTIIVYNDGSLAATGMTITNTIPASTTFVSGSASHGGVETTSGSGIITWPPAVIPAASVISRTFEVSVILPLHQGDPLANVLTLTSAQGIPIEYFEHIEIVGIRITYLPIILK